MLMSMPIFKHRTQDFEYIFNGIIVVMEQQSATVKNILPGAKKSLPHVTETSECGAIAKVLLYLNLFSHPILEVD